MSVGAIMHQIFKIEANMPPTRLPTTVLGRVLMVEARGVGYLQYPPWIMPQLAMIPIAAKIAINGCHTTTHEGTNQWK